MLGLSQKLSLESFQLWFFVFLSTELSLRSKNSSIFRFFHQFKDVEIKGNIYFGTLQHF